MASVLPKYFLLLSTLFVCTAYTAKCVKKDDCTCEMDDGTGTISLWEIDGGKNGPSFENKKQKHSDIFVFSWNPCTSFSKGCSDVKICQKETDAHKAYFPVGKTVKSFTVESNKDVTITYAPVAGPKKTRTAKITLHCDKGTEGKTGLTEFTEQNLVYTATLNNKCACPGACPVPGLSVGSILLIIFFSLLVVYIIGGILINRFGRNVQSIPEVFPNFTFWKDFPFLVKDGFVFTFKKIKNLRGNSSYEKI